MDNKEAETVYVMEKLNKQTNKQKERAHQEASHGGQNIRQEVLRGLRGPWTLVVGHEGELQEGKVREDSTERRHL